ncbi:MAG: CAP domain-containing protein [Ilumatobacteraceae bacterium]
MDMAEYKTGGVVARRPKDFRDSAPAENGYEGVMEKNPDRGVRNAGVVRLTSMTGFTVSPRSFAVRAAGLVAVLVAVVACSDGGSRTESVGAPSSAASTVVTADSVADSTTVLSDDGSTSSSSLAAESVPDDSTSTTVAAGGSPSTTVRNQSTSTTVRAGGTATTVRPVPVTTVRATVPPTAPPTTPAPTVPPTAPPTTPAPTAPPRTIGSCQQAGLDTANSWRAELGRSALSWSSSLYSGACAWATHLAELGGSGAHQSGNYSEVIYWGGSCGGMWSSWRNSSGHYNAITGASFTSAAFVTVSDSNGKCWAVGRMSQ